jgi:release factor glutamine methyltransferase
VKTIAQALQQAARRLEEHETAHLDAEVLLMHVLGKPRSHLHAWPEQALTADQQARFETLVARRAAGEPIAYITGQREFWSLPLEVTADTLIPRPDTEILVEQVLAVLPDSQPLYVADLGTGSGAIALALAQERHRWHVVALDCSLAAITVAQRNARRLPGPRPEFLVGRWCDAFADASLHAIVSNPPYVCDNDPHLRSGDLRFEPHSALAAGADGLDAIRHLIDDARRVLAPDGWLFLEHAPEQTADIHRLFKINGFIDIRSALDLAGRERVSYARRPN